MNTPNNDYKNKDELNNQILMRDFGSKKNNVINPNVNIKDNRNFKTNNPQSKKFPFGGKTPFSYLNKDSEENEDNIVNEKNDVDMNFKDNAGENFFKKMKSNLDKDPMIWEEPEEKKEKSI